MKPNKIYLGDCYQLIKEVEDKSIDLIITDPPYNIEGIHGAGIMKTRNAKNFTREIKESGLDKGVDLKILDDLVRVMKKINIYIWCNKSQIYDYFTYFVSKLNCNYEILVWCKENPIPFCGTHYLCDKEYCLYFWEQGAPVNIPFERAKTYYVSKTNVMDKKDFLHPTIKDLNIIETLILNSSKEGDLVLDIFCGSGTVPLGCKHLKRKYIGFEIDEKWYKVAQDRLQGINAKGEMNLFDI